MPLPLNKEVAVQSLQENIIVKLILQNEKQIHFSQRLDGFEEIKDFTLIINPSEAPLIWLVAKGHPRISFLTVDPFLVCLDYQPEFSEEKLETLHIQDVEQMLILCIAKVAKKPHVGLTINTKAPLVINWETEEAMQVMLSNQEEYSFEYQPTL